MSKNIVVCCDGTGQDGVIPSNVFRIFGAMNFLDPNKQIGSYHRGLGSMLEPRADLSSRNLIFPVVPNPLDEMARLIRRIAGLSLGYGLYENVQGAYNFLVDHYTAEDRIYLFGFSRGAFTARVLAGLIFRCGILRPEHRCRYAEAFQLYKHHLEGCSKKQREMLLSETRDFVRRYSNRCDAIEFLGIWDTVKSVGYLWPKSLPHTRRNPIVKTIRHALSIHETRSFFIHTLWGGLDADTQPPIINQDVMEVWFAGTHSDVGGGYENAKNGLAYLSLKWMIVEAQNQGLIFKREKCQALFQQQKDLSHEMHNELEKRLWRWAEHAPRWELQNDPPPPKRLFRYQPAGHRDISKSAREGYVLLDSYAKDCMEQRTLESITASGVKIKIVNAP
jgi:uncharacterized protein (DUF2235 family)